MTMNISQALLANPIANAYVTALGSNAKVKAYNGAVPANPAAAPAGALLGTLSITGAFGTVAAGSNVIDINETATQTNGSHVNGTPTFFRFTTSADEAVLDVQVGSGAFQVAFTGTIANGQDFSISTAAGGATITIPLSISSQA